MPNKVIEYDLCGASLCQAMIDRITSEANATRGGMIDITIRNIATIGGIPRLILDYGQIYNALRYLLDDIKGAELLQYKLHGKN
jgi:hypothetical protein